MEKRDKRGALLHIYLIIRARPEGSPGSERVQACARGARRNDRNGRSEMEQVVKESGRAGIDRVEDMYIFANTFSSVP